MKLPSFRAAVAASLVGLCLLAAAYADAPRSLLAKVERVSDGDTVIATTSEGTKLRLRLLGIDALEILHGTKPSQSFASLDTGDREA